MLQVLVMVSEMPLLFEYLFELLPPLLARDEEAPSLSLMGWSFWINPDIFVAQMPHKAVWHLLFAASAPLHKYMGTRESRHCLSVVAPTPPPA